MSGTIGERQPRRAGSSGWRSSPRQAEAFQMVAMHRSVAAAAMEMGISRSRVDQLLASFLRHEHHAFVREMRQTLWHWRGPWARVGPRPGAATVRRIA